MIRKDTKIVRFSDGDFYIDIVDAGDFWEAWLAHYDLTGKQIALAKQIVMWASETRASTCIEAGRYDLLQYC